MSRPDTLATGFLPSDVDAPARHSLRAAIMITLTFLPYVAIPVASDTSIALSSLFAFVFAREILARPRLLVPYLVLTTAPFLMLFVQILFFGRSQGGEVQATVWVLNVAPFGGVAAAVVLAPHTVRLTLRVLLIAASGYAIVQKFFLDNGVLPFVGMYDVPGYWSVSDNVQEIVEYVRRPFGWFPEPSFMAGSLALASIALLLMAHGAGRRPTAADLGAVGLVCVAMAFSQSGSALPTLPVVAALAVLPFSSMRRKAAFLLGGVAVWAVVATDLLESRYATPNDSWNDRLASIIGGSRYLAEHPPSLLTGIGVGGSTSLYEHRLIPLEGLDVKFPLADIFSVTGAFVMANGVVVGGVMLGILLVAIVWAFSRRMSWIFGVLAAAAWIVVSTFTISYDSAAWIWALPGLCLGTLVSTTTGDGGDRDRVRTGNAEGTVS